MEASYLLWTLFRRLRPFAAALLLLASSAVNLVLLRKNFFPATTVASTQARGALTYLDGGLKSNGNNDNGDDSIRIIALCGTSHFFDDAFRKCSEWLPILYAGMYQPPENETSPQNVWCEDKIEQWVLSELQRQQIQPDSKVTAIEVIYSSDKIFNRKSPLNTTLAGQSKEPPKWEGGMHTPSRHTHFQRYLSHWGEVAWSKGITCSQDDTKINVYRSRQLWSVAQEEDCAVVHLPAILPYLQGILKSRIQAGLSPENETMTSLLSRRLTHDQAHQSLRSKSGFCFLLTMTTFQPRYSTDALVRHVLCHLLTKQYKPCVAIASWKKGHKHNITVKKGFENTYEAMKDFKFAITMPNHFQDGYIAEKTLNPYLASSVAVTSIPNIGQYVNADGMISCHLPEDELRKVQTYYKGNFKWMPFNTTPEMWKSEEEIMPIKYDPYANNNLGDEPVLEFATSQWEKALQPCIEEIIRVDRDDDTYIEKLMQPYLLNEGQNSIFDGTYVAMSMLRWFQWKNSPLVGGLEDQIRNLDGMWEQTPGWGKPSEKRFQDDIDYYSKTNNAAGLYQYRPAPQIGSTQQNTNISLHSKPSESGLGIATKCTFCESEGVNFNQDMVVPETGGNTCGSIKAMAGGHLNESDACAIMQKEERLCCPGLPVSTNFTKHQHLAKRKRDGDAKMTISSHPPILYGHVHVAKTGGTSLNGMLANTFERVCGHKGYSYDAFQENERAKILEKEGKSTFPKGRSRVFLPQMLQIGFEECDYISVERDWSFWRNTFGNGKFHGLKMELHVPCRDRLDHLMSQCNNENKKIACDAKTDEELFESVKKCYVFLQERYGHDLQKHFDVRCFDFKKQFTEYTEYMSGILQKRRFQSSPFVRRETNASRNRTNECIWGNATVMEKVEKYLLDTVPYYQFCDECIGSENEITLQE